MMECKKNEDVLIQTYEITMEQNSREIDQFQMEIPADFCVYAAFLHIAARFNFPFLPTNLHIVHTSSINHPPHDNFWNLPLSRLGQSDLIISFIPYLLRIRRLPP
jgi:hypothetical protein